MKVPTWMFLRVLLCGLFLRLGVVDDGGGGAPRDDAGKDNADKGEGGDADDGEEQTSTLDAIKDALGDEADLDDDEDDDEDVTPAKAATPKQDEPAKDKGEDKGEGQDDAKPDDDDPEAVFAMPDELKGEGKEKQRERWEKLTKFGRETLEAKQRLQQQVGAFTGLVKMSGASQQEFGELIRFSRLVKSGTREGLEEALAVLDKNRAHVAAALGQEVPGVDLLAEHKDLAEAVANLEITRTHAIELAQGRNAQQAQHRQQQQHHDAQQNQQQYETRVVAAVGAITQWENGIASSDLSYPVLQKQLNARAEWAARNLPPEQWLDDARMYYEGLKAAAADTGRRQNRRTPQPLRDTGRSSGGKPEGPRSTLDAINEALGVD